MPPYRFQRINNYIVTSSIEFNRIPNSLMFYACIVVNRGGIGNNKWF